MEVSEKILFTVEQIKDLLDDEMFRKDLEKVASGEYGCKSSAFRARKFTINMERVFKTFRKLTCEAFNYHK